MPFTPATANETDVMTLQAILAETKIGEVCAYSKMSEAIGRNIANCRYLVLKAIRRLNKDEGAIFAAVHRVGYKRLAADEAHQIGSATRARIRHAAHRASTTISRAVERANDMAPDARRRANAEIGTMSMLAHLATEKVTVLQANDKPQPVAVTMREVLRRMGGGDVA